MIMMFGIPGSYGDVDSRTIKRLIEPGKDFGDDRGSIIKRFVKPLTEPDPKRYRRAILSSDDDHAKSIAPVLTPDKPVYIHSFRKQGPHNEDKNYILETGRIFINYESPFKVEDAPTLRIRPIDGSCRIPFLIQTFLTPTCEVKENGTIEIVLKLPVIFKPDVKLFSVTVNQKAARHRISTGAGVDMFRITIPITKNVLEPLSRKTQDPLLILVDGVLILDKYKFQPSYRLTDFAKIEMENRLVGISMLISGRDFWGAHEKLEIEEIAGQLEDRTNKDYEKVVLANRMTSDRIKYYRNSMRRTSIQVLAEGIGDCDDYTRVMMSLLRAMNIPCKLAVGYLYDFNSMGAHAWVDVGLPQKDGRMHWFICDPTLASVTDDKDQFVQFSNRIYLYPIKIDVAARNLPVDETTDILLNWRSKNEEDAVSPQAYHAIIHTFHQNLKQSLDEKAAAIQAANLMMQREFLFAQGSSYILSNRETSSKQTRLQLKLTSDEELILELGVTDDEYDIESEENQRIVENIIKSYRHLKQMFFPESEARYCLEVAFYRDKYSDRLQKVSLHVFRYLVEHHFQKIMETFTKNGLILPEEADRLNRLHQLCTGKNLYYIQELSRTDSAGIQPTPVTPVE